MTALTSLRFVTAVHVFFFHIHSAQIQFEAGPASLLASVGYVGVNWFFILSGFILTYSYAGLTFAPSGFWRARLARIYPAYFVSLLMAAPLFVYFCFCAPLAVAHGGVAVMRDHLVSFLFLDLILMQAWVPAAALSINPVGWSLSVEALFYLLFPLLLPRLATLSRRALVFMLLGLGLAGVAMSFSYVILSPDGISHVTADLNHLTWLNVYRFNPLVRLPEFLVGVCGALLYFQQPFSSRWATLLVACGLIALSVVTLYSGQIPYLVIHNGLLSLPFLAIIYGIALRPSWVAILEWRVFTMLGEISYSFFLTHGIVIVLFFRNYGRPSQMCSIGEILLCLLIALVLAAGLYHGVEQPMRRRFSKPKAKSKSSEKVLYGN